MRREREFSRLRYAADYEGGLASYAVTTERSRGRRIEESPPRWRSQFQRDRDRIVHCSAFRRLEYKTLVFANHEGDMFRTRLTHSLEVAQIARTIARALGVNEDLTEAIALAHDLGHTPFGHAGQQALDACMRAYGGFEHNFHSLRLVDHLEERYPNFRGLNLMYETREGILKHCNKERAHHVGELGERFRLGQQPSLEAQIANVADEIAYNHHDIDDGLRAELLTFDCLRELPLFAATERTIKSTWSTLSVTTLRHTVIREMLNYFVSDLVAATTARLDELQLATLDDVRSGPKSVLVFHAQAQAQHRALKYLLHRQLYEHEKVIQMAARSQCIVRELFNVYHHDPALLPRDRRAREAQSSADNARQIADYIAGMTDRFALAEYTRILGRDP